MRVAEEIRGELLKAEERASDLRSMLLELEGADEGLSPVPAAAFLTEDLSFEWLVKGLIPAGTTGMLSANPSAGKTTLITQLMAQAAAGQSFMGHPVPSPVRCLYVSAEGSRAAYQERFRTALRVLRINPDELPWYIHPGRWDRFDFSVGLSDLVAMTNKVSARLIVLDTLGYFYCGDENDSTEWKRKAMVPLRRLTRETGAACVIVHHHGKNDDYRGTSAMRGDLDFMFRLDAPPETPNLREFWVTKHKYAAMGYSIRLQFDPIHAFFEEDL